MVPDPTIQAQLTALIAARLRVLLVLIAGGIAATSVANWLLMRQRPSLVPVIEVTGVALALLGAWLLRQPATRRRPVLIGHAHVIIGSLQRVAAAWALNDLAGTVILCVGMILTLAAAVPWGAGPQLVIDVPPTGRP